MAKVELYCLNERAVVVVIETEDVIDSTAISRNSTQKDLTRFPTGVGAIKDGKQLFCARCQSKLYFRGAFGGNDALAIPGYYSVQAPAKEGTSGSA